MNIKRIILASLIVSMVVTVPVAAVEHIIRRPGGPSGRSLPSKHQRTTQSTKDGLIAKAKAEYNKLKESWGCLKRSGYRKCTPAQKKRIIVSATALTAIVVLLVGGVTALAWKRIPEQLTEEERLNIVKSKADHTGPLPMDLRWQHDYLMWEDQSGEYYYEVDQPTFHFLLNNHPTLTRVTIIGQGRIYDSVRVDAQTPRAKRFKHADGTISYWRNEDSTFTQSRGGDSVWLLR